jgi:hypothetical protein
MDTKMKYAIFLTLLLWLPLFGCATNEHYTSDDQQDPPGMSGQRMGSGGGGGRGGGGPQQRPHNMDKDDSEKNEPPPIEAFRACDGKNVGDNVAFTISDGKQITATCQVIDDHLIAVPKTAKKKEKR